MIGPFLTCYGTVEWCDVPDAADVRIDTTYELGLRTGELSGGGSGTVNNVTIETVDVQIR